MSLPQELLNRVNKELKLKVERAASDMQRLKSMIRLEQEVFSVASKKLTDAKQQLVQFQTLSDSKQRAASDIQRQLAIDERELQRLKQEKFLLESRAKDTAQKLESTVAAVDAARSKLLAEEEHSAKNEDAVSRWIDENKTTIAATQQAQQVLAVADAHIKQLRRECERMRVQTAQLSSAVAEQDDETAEIRREIDEAVRARLQLEREALDVRTQISDALAREEVTRRRQEQHVQLAKDIADALEQKKKLIELHKLELADAEAATTKCQRSATAAEHAKANLIASLQAAATACEEAESSERLTSVEATILNSTVEKKRKQLEALRGNAATATATLQRHLAKRSELEAQLKSLETSHDTVDEETQKTSAMLQQYVTEYKTLCAIEDRGRNLIQQTIRDFQHDATETDTVSSQLKLLRSQRQAQSDKEAALQQKLHDLSVVVKDVDSDVAAAAERLAIETAKTSENQYEVRLQKKQAIDELRQELAEWERTVRQAKTAVEATRSALRADARKVSDTDAAAKELRLQCEQLSVDIAGYFDELSVLGLVKQEAASNAEAAFWALEKAKTRAATTSEKVVDQLEALSSLEAQGRMELARLDSEQEGRKIELHSHDDDRHRMLRRLQAAQLQLSQAQTRYSSLMQGMQEHVLQQEREVVNSNPGGKGQRLAAAEKATDSVVEVLQTPEEIEARHVLLRAVEREKLLTYGNKLDSDIVEVERKNVALDGYLATLRQAIRRDHEVLTSTAESGAGDPQLLLLQASTQQEHASLMRDLQQEQAFLATIRDAYDDEVRQYADELQREALLWAAKVQELDAAFAAAAASLSDKKQALQKCQSDRDAHVQHMRSLERAVAQTGISNARLGTDVEKRHQRTMALLDKQRAVQSLPGGVDRTRIQREAEVLEQRLAMLRQRVSQYAVATNNEEFFLGLRRLADKFGVVLPLASADASTEASHASKLQRCQSQGRPSTASGSRSRGQQQSLDPDASRRPASRALVCAVQELQWNVVGGRSANAKAAPSSAVSRASSSAVALRKRT